MTRALHPRASAQIFASILPLVIAAPSAMASASDWVGDGHAAVRLVTATEGRAGPSFGVGVEFRFAPGWHGYWRTPGDAGVPPALDWSATPGLKEAEVDWPAPSRLVVSGLQNAVYEERVVLPGRLAFAGDGPEQGVRVAVDYAACSNVCVPLHADLSLPPSDGPPRESPEAALFADARARVPGAPAAAGVEVMRQEVEGEGAERRLVVVLASGASPFEHPDLFVEGFGDGLSPSPTVELGDGGRTASLTVPLAALQGAANTAAADGVLTLTVVDGRRAATFPGPTLTAPAAPEGIGVVAAFLAALLGGLVLNLMPCVLPVLSLKLVSLARHAGEERRAVRVGLAASGLGVVASFVALAGATVAAKSLGVAVGWGVQFQQPVFLGGMAALTVLFAASLFDWVHFGAPSFASGIDVRGTRRAWVRSFLTGAFATLLATPCSAPFVGTAVGFALARGPSEIIGVFLCLGIGMASPFFAAAIAPGLVAWLPRPGPWMITLRRSLGCLLLATAAWLVAVLDGVAGLAATGLVMLPLSALLALQWWASHRRRSVGVSLTGAATAVLVVLAAVVAGAAPRVAEGPDRDVGDIAFDPSAIGRVVADGGTVLVDVSARWCLTCKVNELAALRTAAVRRRLARSGTVVMRADWTRPDPTIDRYIHGFARYGVPLDVVYGPRRPTGEALPELLTSAAVIRALDRASTVGTENAP